MLLYLFFDSCPKKMETENWPKAADSPLPEVLNVHINEIYKKLTTIK